MRVTKLHYDHPLWRCRSAYGGMREHIRQAGEDMVRWLCASVRKPLCKGGYHVVKPFWFENDMATFPLPPAGGYRCDLCDEIVWDKRDPLSVRPRVPMSIAKYESIVAHTHEVERAELNGAD